MKKALLSLFAVSLLAALAACETTPQTNNAAKAEPEGEVITGSRIPRKGGSGADAVTRGSGADYKSGQTQGTK